MKNEARPTIRALRAHPIAHLALTLKTARALKAHGIERIGTLVDRVSDGSGNLGLDAKRETEIRDVLASRGL